MKDFYYILGTEANCTFDEIKEAYRKLSKKFHPDLNQGDEYFHNRFREIKEAYDTLSDPGKRREYDASLKRFKSSSSGEENKTRDYYREQPQYQQYQRTSAYHRPKTKGPGIGMTIVFILLGLVGAIYLVKSFTNSNTHKTKLTAAATGVSYKIHKHHKKKHVLKNKTGGDSSGLNSEDASATPDKPLANNNKSAAVNNNKPITPAANKSAAEPGDKPVQSPNGQPLPSNSKAVESPDKPAQSPYLYATNVRANATGVINLRKYDTYNSEVIKTIPANSKVFVLEKGDDYYRVYFDHTIGFVPKWSLLVK